MPVVKFDPNKHQKFAVGEEIFVVDKTEYPNFWNQYHAGNDETEWVMHQVNANDDVIHHTDEPTRNLFKKKKKEIQQVGDLIKPKRK